jgi:hypothetical protein
VTEEKTTGNAILESASEWERLLPHITPLLDASGHVMLGCAEPVRDIAIVATERKVQASLRRCKGESAADLIQLRIWFPIGYVWHRESGIAFDPDEWLQEAIRLIFTRFRKLGRARQVLRSLAAEQMHFPCLFDGKKLVNFGWTPIRYRNVISLLKNPFYAGGLYLRQDREAHERCRWTCT